VLREFFKKKLLCDVVEMSDPHHKQRVVIQFLVKSGEKPSEIVRKLQVVYGAECMSKTRVFEWAKRFKEGRESVEDDPRAGAPVTARTDENVERLRARITSDRRLSLCALSDELNINKESVCDPNSLQTAGSCTTTTRRPIPVCAFRKF
jgi:hypothetical protein